MSALADKYVPETPFEATVIEKLSALEQKTAETHSALFGDKGIESRIRSVEIKQGWWAGAAVGISTALSYLLNRH